MLRLVWWVQWHRRLGLMVALLVILLAVTGILINHSQSMGWHKQPVYSALVARLYGIPVTVIDKGFPLQEHWFTQVGHQLYRDRQPLAVECPDTLLGVAVQPDMLALLCGNVLLLLEPSGELIERVTQLPDQALAVTAHEDGLLLRTSAAVWHYSDATGSWSAFTGGAALSWSSAAPLPADLQDWLAQRNPVPGISREQVLLDLHSGRLFGSAGVLVVDLVGIVVILLAASGLFTWIGRWRRHRRRR
ncbi:MAG: PepSY domain-containing protein [Gammaproteobacteria bacterium]|jgi:uncharacterized iron-regulated membrane protein